MEVFQRPEIFFSKSTKTLSNFQVAKFSKSFETFRKHFQNVSEETTRTLQHPVFAPFMSFECLATQWYALNQVAQTRVNLPEEILTNSLDLDEISQNPALKLFWGTRTKSPRESHSQIPKIFQCNTGVTLSPIITVASEHSEYCFYQLATTASLLPYHSHHDHRDHSEHSAEMTSGVLKNCKVFVPIPHCLMKKISNLEYLAR